MDEIEMAKQTLRDAGFAVLPKPKSWCEYKEVPQMFTGGYKKDRRDFVKFYDKVWAAMAEKDVLEIGEYKFLMRVFPYCEMNSNCLVRDIDGKLVPMGFRELAEAVGYGERQTKNLLRSIVDKNLMCTINGGLTEKYAVNPELYWKGGNMDEYGILKFIFYTNIKDLRNNAKNAKKQMRTLYLNGRASTILYEKKKNGVGLSV